MAISNLYILRELEFAGASPVYMVQLTQRTVDPGISLAINKAAGMPEASWVSAMSLAPMISWSTTEITRMLTCIDYEAGCAVGSGLTYTGCNAYFAKASDLGTRATGSSAMKVATNRGLVCPGELSVRQGSEATMSATLYNSSTDGSTHPWTTTTGAAVSSATMEADQKYTLGKATLNGSAVNGVQGWSLSFGCVHQLVGSDGKPLPQFIFIPDSNPTIKVQTNDASYLSSIGASGVAITSSSDVYLTAMTKAGLRVADATTSHIRIRTSTGFATCGPVSASGNNPAECEITYTPYKSGSTFLTVATGVAIS